MADITQAGKKEEPWRRERAQHILDTALTLVLRWGYNKTTIDDIAQQAGVAKGTVYLHWKSREELFEALVQRERVKVYEDIQQRITQDPQGWTLRGIIKHSALATLKHPLIKALLLGDREVLGKLANHEMSQPAFAERIAGFKAYLQLLREHGLVRTDLSLEDEVYLCSAALSGFFYAAPLLPEEIALTTEAQADLVAEMVSRTLEVDRPISPEEYQAVFSASTQYLKRTTQAAAKPLPDHLQENAE